MFLEISQNLQESTCATDSFNKFAGLFLGLKLYLKIVSGAGVFLWIFCVISKNTFFYRAPPVAASVVRLIKLYLIHTNFPHFHPSFFRMWHFNIAFKQEWVIWIQNLQKFKLLLCWVKYRGIQPPGVLYRKYSP